MNPCLSTALLLLGLVSCGSEAGSPRTGGAGHSSASGALAGSNLLLVTLDTTRADRLGAYGYEGAGTPHLDRLAASGVRFARCISVAPITLPSHASILSGTQPFEHGARNNGTHALPDDVPTLSTALKGEGYRTGAVVSAFVLDARFGLARGFDSYDDDLSAAREAALFMFRETDGADSLRRARAFLSEVPDGEPWFLWLHLFDPHANYTPPEPYRSRFEDPYQGEISFADSVVGELLSTVRSRGEGDRTLVAVTADHGESLGDHGETTHGLFVYDATTHVPWILAHPGLQAGHVVEPVVSGIDLAPTVLDLLGVPHVGSMSGRSWATACLEGTQPEGAPGAYSEGMPALLDHGWSDLRSLREDSWRYVRAPRPELYERTPLGGLEENDLVRDRADEAERLAAKLTALFARGERDARAESVDAGDPAVREALAALGYASGQGEARTGDGPLADPKDKAGFWLRRQQVMERIRNKEYAEAEPLVRSLAREEPGDKLLQTAHAEVLRQLGREQDALVVLRATIDSGRAEVIDWVELAQLEHDLGVGDWKDRLAMARALGPREPGPHVKEGDLLVEDGDFAGARKAYDQALALDDQCAEAWVGMGHLLHQQGHDVEAQRALEQGLAGNAYLTDGWFNLGVVLEALGNPDKAEETYQRALALDDGHVRALVNLGGLARAKGDRAAAEEHYRRAFELDPAEARGAYNLALILIEAQQGARAEEILLGSLALNPGVPQLERLRVFAIEAQGDPSRAGLEARALLPGQPGDAWLHVFAMEGLVADGDLAGARALLAKAQARKVQGLEPLLQQRPLLRSVR